MSAEQEIIVCHNSPPYQHPVRALIGSGPNAAEIGEALDYSVEQNKVLSDIQALTGDRDRLCIELDGDWVKTLGKPRTQD